MAILLEMEELLVQVICQRVWRRCGFYMMGGQFAGHYENPGELIVEDGVEYKYFME